MAGRKGKNNPIPWLLMGLGSLLILGVVVWQTIQVLPGSNQPSGQSIPTESAEIPFPEVPRIALDEAKTAFDTGSALIIDIRDAEYYEVSHIKGAINIPYSQINTRMKELDPAQHILTYCA